MTECHAGEQAAVGQGGKCSSVRQLRTRDHGGSFHPFCWRHGRPCWAIGLPVPQPHLFAEPQWMWTVVTKE